MKTRKHAHLDYTEYDTPDFTSECICFVLGILGLALIAVMLLKEDHDAACLVSAISLAVMSLPSSIMGAIGMYLAKAHLNKNVELDTHERSLADKN